MEIEWVCDESFYLDICGLERDQWMKVLLDEMPTLAV